MADYITTDAELTSIANAIRAKGGTSADLIYPSGFVDAINNLPITPEPVEDWDFEWSPDDGDIENFGWTKYINGTGSVTYTNSGMEIYSANGNNYAYIGNEDYNVDNIIMEVGFSLSAFSNNNGLRICASNGTNGPQVCAPNSTLCLMDGTSGYSSYTKLESLSANTHYVIKLIRETTNCHIYLNGERVMLILDNSSFAYCIATRIWSQGQGGTVLVDSIKIKVN